MAIFEQSEWTLGEGLTVAAQMADLSPEQVGGFIMIVQLADGRGFKFTTDNGIEQSPAELLNRLTAAILPLITEVIREGG